MPLVLQVVKHGHLRATAYNRGSESRIQQNIDPVRLDGQRQDGLLPNNPRGPESRAHGLAYHSEVRTRGAKARAGLAIGEKKIFVRGVDLAQRSQQVAQINLGAAHATRNQVQRIHADAKRPHAIGDCQGGLRTRESSGPRFRCAD